ncbi:lipopolysaccharide biosynthesis protein [Bacteroides thetaiotaomicron]|jgi:hypothetical protein|uniref:lipopolysaccharide biosynthesis protein n=2 Tax=Bacteroides thetaiotaomicron TaxID=818 RepID=UPI00189A2A94|nr:lipopolysaccharide biosynthesis protein [Bacteroides thetaiotaomicron]MBV3856103.1 lipopolysaccharide biosynthesis protein [Bacteroides thetaiotaomicron]MBV3928667.1 lipopolysaccharide biosynthesis protein [Bacteroides thetaiotaomicron]MBV3933807.1 lipopolysaccharide biosynthesis protein [Bacteroides thetaiotaomicron]MBV3942834.1 lipopolysaccharide biosynthesis protein [Bacteroides thetaiotaomicron]MBV3957189.1 lipopolysaccharide biosynthesis protein [Bacteroides thetaiotaomicron]
MVENEIDGNRIAKNTLLLYLRMLFQLGIALYTSRAVLNALGVIDFGIYNVVGGIIVIFSFLNNAMASSTQRFLVYHLGTNDSRKLKQIFSSAIIIHFVMAVVVVGLAEIMGLWFLQAKMIIPMERLEVAKWVFHLSVISSAITILSVPYNAAIIANERMGAFAAISIIETLLKLCVAIFISFCNGDRLLWYAGLLLGVSVIVRTIYGVYCSKSFPEAKLIFPRNNKLLYKEMTSFAGWSLVGNLSVVGYTQGINLLLNIFFGPAINAARGIAVQVQNAVYGFVRSFQTAVNPQITKSYAIGDLKSMHLLIYRSSKLSFYLTLMLSLPIIIETPYVLSLWLNIVPDYTVAFCRLTFISCMIESISNPFMIGASATGKIKKYHLIIGSILLLIVPVSYIFLKLGFEPIIVYIIDILIQFIAQIIRLFLCRHLFSLNILFYIKDVISRIVGVAVLSVVFSLLIDSLFIEINFINAIVVAFFSFISVCVVSYVIGLTKSERTFFNNKMLKIFHR